MTSPVKLSDKEKQQLISLGQAVINTETKAVADLLPRIDDNFARACAFMLHCKGRIVVTGMGKSGHVGNKIAATLASTGSPSFFMHPGEASHGDLGMITSQDVVLAMSNSGETGELVTIVPIIKRLGVPLISMTGNPRSTLATSADVALDISVEKEACPLGLARLLVHVNDIMHKGNEVPSVPFNASLKDALMEMTRKSLGMTAIVDEQNRLQGIYTDGDLRRTLDQGIDIHNVTISEVMQKNCIRTSQHILAAEALQQMQEKKINALLVIDDEGRLVGALNMHDMLRAGVV
jgi:arabinose-5-phosphate isomerase